MKLTLTLFFVITINANNAHFYKKISLTSNEHNVHWTLENRNRSIRVAGSVPGGVYSDLQKAGVIGDILKGFNDVLTRWIAHDSWTYEGRFYVPREYLNAEVTNLVLEGVDTIASLHVNEHSVGATDNMFVRYVYGVKRYLKTGENKLKIKFVSPIDAARHRSERQYVAPDCVPDEYNGECHANQLRKMQASFGWDWGPAFPSVGLWKPASIEFYTGNIIRSVTTHIKKLDEHWHIRIKAYMESSLRRQQFKGYLNARLVLEDDKAISVQQGVDLDVGDDGTCEAEMSLMISENLVDVWWPNGYGEQTLYDLFVSLTTSGQSHGPPKHLKIGFRTVELIEEDASLKLGNTTESTGLTFYFKINGYPLFMKGSNWIPAHILPELGYNRNTVDSLLMSARDAHMSMLRVWGGGLYESDYFYHRCDQLGILIWQDFMFACSMYPVDVEFISSVKTEVEQNVKRLQHHASIALWAGNNENEVALRGNWYNTESQFTKYKADYIRLYVETIKPIVEDIDSDRRYLVSSPSNGIESEEEGYIAVNPYDSHYGDTHYYNYLADNWDANIYPGTRFASEYGFQSLPSLRTMKTAITSINDLHLNSSYSKHRQHSPLGYVYIASQLNKHLKLDEDQPDFFEKFVFYSQIVQAMAMKTETELYRQDQANWFTMGALYWQLNDVWQAPSWSGIEYGGRWKMLHYFAKSFFSPVLVSPRLLECGDVDVYLINDRFVPIVNGVLTVETFNYSSLISVTTQNFTVGADPLSAKKQDVHLNLWRRQDKKEIFMKFSLHIEGILVSPYNYVFLKPLKSIVGLKEPHIQISVSDAEDSVDNGTHHTVTIEVDTVVLFLWLETNIEGSFEDNGFIVTQPRLSVAFISRSPISPTHLEKSITYQYYTN